MSKAVKNDGRKVILFNELCKLLADGAVSDGCAVLGRHDDVVVFILRTEEILEFFLLLSVAGEHFADAFRDVDFADAALCLRCFQHADGGTEFSGRGENEKNVFSVEGVDGFF